MSIVIGKYSDGRIARTGDIVVMFWGGMYGVMFYRYHKIIFDKKELIFRFNDCYNHIELKRLKYIGRKLPKGIEYGINYCEDLKTPLYKYLENNNEHYRKVNEKLRSMLFKHVYEKVADKQN